MGGRGVTLRVGSLGSRFVLVWEDLNIVGGRNVCMLMRDRRLVGPEELLDLVVPVLWDDRGCIRTCRSASSLESAGGESSRCLHPMSYDKKIHTPSVIGGIIWITHPTRYICFPC